MRLGQHGDPVLGHGRKQRRPARLSQPVERVIAEEEIERSAVQRDTAAPEYQILRCSELEARAGQGLAPRTRMGPELIGIFGGAERAHETDGEPAARGAFAERALCSTAPARGKLPPESR